MDEPSFKKLQAVRSSENGLDLTDAVRRARIEKAEKSNVSRDLQAAELSHLENLKDELSPVLAQLPRDADLFNHGLVPGERPRLYIDMIAFVEMSRDRRTYRFLMDSPSGRQLLGESDDITIMALAVTNYLGRRLVDRENAIHTAVQFEPIEKTEHFELENSSSISTIPVITEVKRSESGRLFIMFLIGLAAGIAAVYVGTHWDIVIISQIDRLNELISGKSGL
jgi:hypothetical protein